MSVKTIVVDIYKMHKSDFDLISSAVEVSEKELRSLLKDNTLKVVNTSTNQIITHYNVIDQFAFDSIYAYLTKSEESDSTSILHLAKGIDTIPPLGYDTENVVLPEGDTRKFSKMEYNCFQHAPFKTVPSFIDWDNVEDIPGSCFNECALTGDLVLPLKLKTVGKYGLACYNLTSVRFMSTPTRLDSDIFYSGLSDIYVPWSENEVANAPWGARNATIHYNSNVNET